VAGQDLELKEIQKVIDDLKGFSVNLIQFLGGEPFMRSDFPAILCSAKNAGIEYNIATNGIAISEQLATKLAEIAPRQIAFSIDGASARTNDLIRGKGTFDRAINNVRMISDLFDKHGCGTRLGIQMTLHRLNSCDIVSIVELARGLRLHFVGFDALKAFPSDIRNQKLLSAIVLDARATAECLEQIAMLMSRQNEISISALTLGSPVLRAYLNMKYDINLRTDRKCEAASEMLYIRADGRVFPCNYCSGFSPDLSSKNVHIENLNVRTQSIESIIDSDYFRSFYQFAHNGAVFDDLEFCRRCPDFDICTPCPLSVIKYGRKVCEPCIWAQRHVINQRGAAISNIMRAQGSL
jgi:radical SAM protein with 4Fe4S-binding SPASM domain